MPEQLLEQDKQHLREVQYMSAEVSAEDKQATMTLPPPEVREKIKLVAIDLDGTTLREDKTFGERLLKVMDLIQERGVIVAICSGRAPESVAPYAHTMHLDRYQGYCICFNGGALINLKDPKKDLFVSTMTAQDLIDIESQARAHHNFVHAYSTRRVLLTESNVIFTEMEIAASSQPFEQLNFPDEVNPNELAYKLIAVGLKKSLDEMRDNLPADFSERFNIARTNDNFLEFMHKDCSKGATLIELCKILGIGMENVAAFGDAENDIEMVQMAGVGVAVANAMPTLKAVAPYRAINYIDDGVAIYLEQFFGLPPQA